MRRSFLFFFILIFSIPAFCQFRKLSRLVKRGNFEEALEYAHRKANDLSEAKYNRLRIQRIHLMLGKIHFRLGDYTASEKELKTSLSFVNDKQASRKRLTLADFDVIDEMAMFYVNTGNFQQGRALIDRSLMLRKRKINKKDPTNFRPYLPLGMLFYYQSRFDSARLYLHQYQKQIRNSNYTGFLDINRYADTYQVLSDIEMKTGHWKSAKKYAKKSARLQRHPWTKKQSGKNYIGRVVALNSLSVAYYRNARMNKAVRYNKKALSLYRRKYDREYYVLVPVYLQKAQLSIGANKIDTARAYLEKVILLQQEFIADNFNHLSEYEKENYQLRLREQFHSVNNMMLQLYEDGKVNDEDPFWSQILNYTIHSKALILNETTRMVERLRKSKDSGTRDMFEAWRSLKNEWAYLSTHANRRSKQRLLEVQQEIVGIEKEMTTVPSERKTNTDWMQIRQKLKEDEAAIEISRIDRRASGDTSGVVYLAFIIRKSTTHPKIIVLKDGEELEQRYIRYYFNTIIQRLEDTVSFGKFWKPFSEALVGINTIYFAADGVFHLINADAVKEPSQEFLAMSVSILNLTGVGQLVFRDEKRFVFSSAALFGAPDFSGYSFQDKTAIGYGGEISELPGAAAEISYIGELLTKNKIRLQIFRGNDASEATLSSTNSADVLHFATHGFFKSDAFGSDPMLGSGLLLSKDTTQQNDGILTAYEASTLHLDSTQLVVLSACKTGLGAVKEGEGVYGLQRAFEVAGVDYILMTLWNVDDTVTKEFMITFYQKLLEEKNVPLAFKKTQLQLKSRYADVYYWGAFKLIISFSR
jgi:hypothetical protein